MILTFLAAGLLAGCGDPLREMPRLSEIDADGGAGQADALPAPEGDRSEDGLLSTLFAAPAPEEAPQGAEDAPAAAAADQIAPAPEAAAEDAATAAPAPPAGGLLGFLKRRAEAAKTVDTPQEADPAPLETAALTTTPADPPVAAPGAPSVAPRTAGTPDYRQVGPGVTLPFGELARLCGVPERRLGEKVATYPERGRGYALYDSAPGSTVARTLFLTGFDDGCARQFTGALAMFAAPELHEQLRYGLPSKTLPYSAVDEAYETVKSKVCRVGKGKPCGRSLAKLSRSTAFVTVYPDFGSARYANILLHDGALLAFSN
ncbi:hypothetical protein M4578_02970 [Salipiger sp. P9]|nr:hypothetical protein [Salipiger pentaromativorans]